MSPMKQRPWHSSKELKNCRNKVKVHEKTNGPSLIGTGSHAGQMSSTTLIKRMGICGFDSYLNDHIMSSTNDKRVVTLTLSSLQYSLILIYAL